MSRNQFLSLFAAFSIIFFTGCDKIKVAVPISIPKDINISFNIKNPIAAGTEFSEETTANNADLLKAIEDKGGSKDKVTKVEVKSFTMTIPANAGWAFEALESAEVFIDGNSVGTLPAGITGTSATFKAPAVVKDLKEQFLSGADFTISIKGKTKSDIKPTTLTSKVSVVMTVQL